MAWTVETLNAAVDAEVNALPADMRAQLARISFLIQEFGLERVREPHVKHLQGLMGNADAGKGRCIAGALCRRVGPARRYRPGVREETQKPPRREIDLALDRAKEVLS